MIGETTGVATPINSERILRQNSDGEVPNRENEGEVSEQTVSSDSVSLSAESIALAGNVPPAGESSEVGNTAETERGVERPPELPTGGIDIRT